MPATAQQPAQSPDEVAWAERPAGGGTHIVKQGECMLSIAESSGHFWKTIWDHPDNEALKSSRPEPTILFPGDRVAIPPLREREESKGDKQRHRFRRKGVPVKFRLMLLRNGKPRVNAPYTLDVDGALMEGQTDAKGVLEVFIPPLAREGILRVNDDPPSEHRLQFGRLDPPESVSGIQSRLRALGFDAGPPDGTMGPNTREALARFQAHAGLEPTGIADEETCEKLEEAFRS